MNKIIYLLFFCAFCACQHTSNHHSISTLDSLSSLLQSDSTDINLLKKRADIYINNHEYYLAKNDIDRAYTLFKNDIDLLLKRGEVYFNLNKTKTSKESWERCLKINPNQIECRQKLTELLCLVRSPQCKNMIDTLALVNSGIVSLPLIVALKELGEYKLAVGFLDDFIQSSPMNKEALSLLSIIYSDTSSFNNYFNTKLAEECFQKIIKFYPNYAQVYYNFGKHKQNIFEYNEAMELYDKNIQLDSTNKHSYYNMGFCAIQLGKNNQAISYFTEALLIDNSFLLAYHARAYLYDLTNNPEQATKDWKNCLLLNPSYIPALKALTSR